MNPVDQERQPEPTGDEPEPDYRFTHAGERTFLARLRAALALVGHRHPAHALKGKGSAYLGPGRGFSQVPLALRVLVRTGEDCRLGSAGDSPRSRDVTLALAVLVGTGEDCRPGPVGRVMVGEFIGSASAGGRRFGRNQSATHP
jgi:hypothetical protein